MQIDLNSGILLIGIVQGLFLSVSLLFQKKGPRLANTFLVTLLMSFSIALAVHLMTVMDYWALMPHLYVTASAVIFLFGPALYLYVLFLTQPEQKPGPKHLAHLLPFLLNIAAFIPLLLMNSNDLSTFIERGQQTEQTSILLPFLKIVFVTGYTIAALILLQKHERRIENYFSNIDLINLRWLKTLTYGFLLFELVLTILLFAGIDLSTIPGKMDSVFSLFLVVLIFMTGFKGMHQPEIFRGTDMPEQGHTQKIDEGKYHRSTISNEEKEKLEQSLSKLFDQQQLYLDPLLDLKKLAHKTKVTTHKLSQYLNECKQISFYDYVNSHRITDAQSKLLETDTSILDIAFEVGFNNKATFNKAFKRVTAMTPSQYRLKNQRLNNI